MSRRTWPATVIVLSRYDACIVDSRRSSNSPLTKRSTMEVLPTRPARKGESTQHTSPSVQPQRTSSAAVRSSPSPRSTILNRCVDMRCDAVPPSGVRNGEPSALQQKTACAMLPKCGFLLRPMVSAMTAKQILSLVDGDATAFALLRAPHCNPTPAHVACLASYCPANAVSWRAAACGFRHRVAGHAGERVPPHGLRYGRVHGRGGVWIIHQFLRRLGPLPSVHAATKRAPAPCWRPRAHCLTPRAVQPLFMEHTIRTKDEWVRESYTRIVRERIRIETNETLQDLGARVCACVRMLPRQQSANRCCRLPAAPADVDERGMGSAPQRRFYDNPDCHQAYKNFFCWMNFPRCNEEDKSLIMCRSVCENFFKACKVRPCHAQARIAPDSHSRLTTRRHACAVTHVP